MTGRVRWALTFLASVGALALTAVPASAGGGCHREVEGAAEAVSGAEVALERNCFAPGVLQVAPGTTVRFSNHDEVAHVVLGTGWGSGQEVGPGGSVEYPFDRSGTYAYSCNLHPSMNGAVVVGEAAAAAASAPAGPAEPPALVASSTRSGGIDGGSMALGALAGSLAAAATGRWGRRSRAHPAS